MSEYTPERIKALRRRAGMSQEAFAAALGVTVSTVTKWEGDRARPRTLAALRALRDMERQYPDPKAMAMTA